MSKSIKNLTSIEKKRLNQLIASVAITGIVAMLGVILRNVYIFALQGIGLLFTIITLCRMIVITKINNEQ